MSNQKLTQIGIELKQSFRIFDIDILHENYSCTVDFGRKMSECYQTKLENEGYSITHEEDTIYTIEK